MIRINVVAEGQSEMFFVKKQLSTYLYEKTEKSFVDSRSVLTSKDKKTNNESRGGIQNYIKPKQDIISWLKESDDTYITTMFDLFRLPKDFPGYDLSLTQEPYMRVQSLENAFKEDILKGLNINQVRFIPYIQLHEFEALLFTNLDVLKDLYLEQHFIKGINKLISEVKGMQPELINNGPTTAPSKRLSSKIPYAKGSDVGEFLAEIGIDKIRESCEHFSAWIEKLLNLPELT